MGRRRSYKYRQERNKKLFKILKIVLSFGAIFLFKSAQRFTFVDVALFPLWYVALPIGVVAGAVVAVKHMAEKTPICERIFMFLVITVITFALIGSVFVNINHDFDFGDAPRYYVEIEDKNGTSGTGHGVSCEIEVTVNGDTFDIAVPRLTFRNLDIGDTYVVEYHEGALGVPYYIGVGPVP